MNTKKIKKVCIILFQDIIHKSRLHREAQSLANFGFETTVLAFGNKKSINKYGSVNFYRVITFDIKFGKIIPNFPIIRFFRWAVMFLEISYKFLIYGIKEKYDFYISHNSLPLPLVYICSLKNRAKIIYNSDDFNYNKSGSRFGSKIFLYWMEKIFIKKVDHIIEATDSRSKIIMDVYGIDKSRISTILNVPPIVKRIDLNSKLIHKYLNIDKSFKIVLYQGGLIMDRGIEKLIESVVYFNKRNVLVLMGDGCLKNHLYQLVEQKKIKKKVFFIPTQPYDTFMDFTASADIGIFPLQNTCLSYYYGIGNKTFEYLMAGLPILVSGFPELKKIIEENKVGLIIDPEDPKNIANKVNLILTDDDLYNKCKKNARKVALHKYNWANEEKKLLNIFKIL